MKKGSETEFVPGKSFEYKFKKKNKTKKKVVKQFFCSDLASGTKDDQCKHQCQYCKNVEETPVTN